MSTVKALSAIGRPVAYYPTIARAFGGNVATAIFVCQFIYWRGVVGDRQIYKTRDEIEKETGIGHDAQRRIVTQLKKEKMLTVVKKGMPARNYYRFDWEAIDKRINDFIASTSSGESPPLDVGNPEHKRSGIPSTTSETTTETTTETRKEQSGARRIRHPTGVMVGESRYNRMCQERGKEEVDNMIDRVVLWSESTGRKYKDYAAAAETWFRRDDQKKDQERKSQYANELPGTRDYTYERQYAAGGKR
jgi:hypothetical protein